MNRDTKLLLFTCLFLLLWILHTACCRWSSSPSNSSSDIPCLIKLARQRAGASAKHRLWRLYIFRNRFRFLLDLVPHDNIFEIYLPFFKRSPSCHNSIRAAETSLRNGKTNWIQNSFKFERLREFYKCDIIVEIVLRISRMLDDSFSLKRFDYTFSSIYNTSVSFLS